MTRRVDPDALHEYIRSMWGETDADRICPEVAEPATPAEQIDEAKPAAADTDPRRLTDDAMFYAWDSGETVEAGLRAVADAQWERAKVTISEAEIRKQFDNPVSVFTAKGAIDWLRSYGVEVVRDRRRQ